MTQQIECPNCGELFEIEIIKDNGFENCPCCGDMITVELEFEYTIDKFGVLQITDEIKNIIVK
jgi:uncharacterized Zn finger protein